MKHCRLLIPGNIIFVDSIPKNENGKPMRREAAELVKGQEPVIIINYKNQGVEWSINNLT